MSGVSRRFRKLEFSKTRDTSDTPRLVKVYMLSLAIGLLAAPSPRFAVFGGTGYLGSRVCKTLVSCGCSVVSVSRSGRAPAWAASEDWSQQVSWLAADVLAAEQITTLPAIDGAISCVGNMRPSPKFAGFFGLHWDYQQMVLENGVVTERIAEAAKRAGATRFVYVSASSTMKYAYGGALMGYIDGKESGEASVRRCFADENTCIVGPSLILGGGRLDGVSRLYTSVTDSGGVRGGIRFWKDFKGTAATGYVPQDAVGEVAQSPPSHVDDVARAACAGLLDTIGEAQLAAFHESQREEDAIRGTLKVREEQGAYNVAFLDGRDQIKHVSEESGTPSVLAAAAAALAKGSQGGGKAVDDVADGSVAFERASELGQLWIKLPLSETSDLISVRLQNDALKERLASGRADELPWRVFSPGEMRTLGVESVEPGMYIEVNELGEPAVGRYVVTDVTEQSPSAFDSPNEGFLFAYTPFLFPWPPGLALFSFFAGACLISAQNTASAASEQVGAAAAAAAAAL